MRLKVSDPHPFLFIAKSLFKLKSSHLAGATTRLLHPFASFHQLWSPSVREEVSGSLGGVPSRRFMTVTR